MSKLFRRQSSSVVDQQQALGKAGKPDEPSKISKSRSMRFSRQNSSASIRESTDDTRADDESNTGGRKT
jgi:hypothetical protein